jgi:large subunit ribosomal protein L25
MSFDFSIEYQSRDALGKGASRRLRRDNDMVPGIIYGGDKTPETIMIEQRHMRKALENEAVYSHILTLNNGKNTEQVVLKNLQRHPYKAFLQHIDFQRIDAKKLITMHVPLHFENEATCPGVKAGGNISHLMSDLEIKCLPKDLPEFIEVDLANLELDQVIHLSEIKLPKGVEITIEAKENNASVATVHMPRVQSEDDEDTTVEGTASDEESSEENGNGKDKK